jgi:hypothetical protein
MPRVEALVPRLVSDAEASVVLRIWRRDLVEELGKKEARKMLRHMSMVGVALQVEEGRVVNCICLDEIEEKSILGMRGSGWLVYEGVASRSGGRTLGKKWDTEAECEGDVDVQGRKGYGKKYRHGNHRQEVKGTNKKIVNMINNRNRK